MNNEPVAWAVWEGRPHDLFFTKEDADELCRLKGGDAKTVPLYTHPDEHALGIAEAIGFDKGYKAATVKELTDEDKSMLIRTLKWSEDLLRIAGNDEAVSDVQDCLMILRKAQEK